MMYKIFPPIGIARLGDDKDHFYVGPEIPTHPGIEIEENGLEHEVVEYKDANFRIKRQAARFRIFEFPDDGGKPRPVQLPAGAIIEWTVHVVNKKAAVRRAAEPLKHPQRPQAVPNPVPLTIDPKPRPIAGANTSGVKFDSGTFMNIDVPLGELRTDKNQNLLVLGGVGFSSTFNNHPTLNGFYTNPGWHDDVCDGPVTAKITFPNGQVINSVSPAWIVVAPPDFAPQIEGIVTLYDIVFQVGVDHFGIAAPDPPSFTAHIFPLLRRTSALRWVNTNPEWTSMSTDWPALADNSANAQALRTDNAGFVLDVENSSILSDFKLTDVQKSILDKWVRGQFVSDWQGIPIAGTTVSPDGMTRAALDTAVGQGFFPGIEAGVIVQDPTLYSKPFEFRIDHASVNPGDLTALMAQPWQADFTDCAGNWWPAQRPDDVRTSLTNSTTKPWARKINNYLDMVRNFGKLGFVLPRDDGTGQIVFIETQRAPDTLFI